MNEAHGFRSRNHPKEMALIVEFLKGRVFCSQGVKPFFPGAATFFLEVGVLLYFISPLEITAVGVDLLFQSFRFDELLQ